VDFKPGRFASASYQPISKKQRHPDSLARVEKEKKRGNLEKTCTEKGKRKNTIAADGREKKLRSFILCLGEK